MNLKHEDGPSRYVRYPQNSWLLKLDHQIVSHNLLQLAHLLSQDKEAQRSKSRMLKSGGSSPQVVKVLSKMNLPSLNTIQSLETGTVDTLFETELSKS